MGISTRLIKYIPEFKDKWDDLIILTEPGSVIHKREFLEYHSNIYEDLSLCVFSEKVLTAVIPGTKSGDVWTSHAGLTYGGILANTTDPLAYIEIIEECKQFLRTQGITKMQFILPSLSFSPKTLPLQIYALSQTGFDLEEIHLNQVIEIRFPLAKKKQSNARAAERKNLILREGSEYLPRVFSIIEENLNIKYERTPVHSLDELRNLKSKFDDDIRVYAVLYQNKVLAGAITFGSQKVINIQYLGGTLEGKRLRAQDYLISELYKVNKALSKNISFGKSTSGEMAALNSPLYEFKSEYNSIPENIFVFSCEFK